MDFLIHTSYSPYMTFRGFWLGKYGGKFIILIKN